MRYKTNTNEVLKRWYDERGLGFALDLALNIMASPDLKKVDKNPETRAEVLGELCESVLEICIMDFIKRNSPYTDEWFYTKGLVLKDLSNHESKFLTEIDLVLFTPNKVYLFECKGHNGDKTVVGKGVIKRKGRKDVDVFKQHSNHGAVFIKNFDSFRKKIYTEQQAYQMIAFSFAPGSLVDKRSEKFKNFMPFMGFSGVLQMFTNAIGGKEVWMLNYAAEAVRLIQKDKDFFVSEHIKYVRGLHSDKSRSGKG